MAFLAGVTSLATFTALNPFLTAQPSHPTSSTEEMARLNPLQRARRLIDHRMNVSRGQQRQFPHNAVTTLPEKLQVVAVQGFGRFGPFGPWQNDSTRRYDFDQDWGPCSGSLG